jgi:hypothetical protein
MTVILADGHATMRLHAALRGHAGLAAVLDCFDDLDLPDAWLVAGCVAQTVWNLAAGAPAATGIRDIDLVYCDPTDLSQAAEAAHEARLVALLGDATGRLDVKNQARVHLWYEARFGRAIAPWRSSTEAIASYPTTATAVGVRMRAGRLEVCAPFGLEDLFALVVRPNKALASQAVYEAKAARWKALWPALRVVDWDAKG